MPHNPRHRGRQIATIVLSVLSSVSACSAVATQDKQNNVIELHRQVLQFMPSRADLTVGIVWFSVFTPGEDWLVRVPESEQANYQDAGTYKYVELKQVGVNRFELPALKVEPARKEKSGPVCVSVKAWFNEVLSEYDSLYWTELGDRYALATFCTNSDVNARPRDSQNLVATLEDFRRTLERPFALSLRNDVVPWRPTILVDTAGAVYFHSMLIGRFTPGALSHHLVEAWKLNVGGKLERVAVPDPTSQTSWRDRVRSLTREPYVTLLRAALTDVVGRDATGRLYASSSCQQSGSPSATQIVRIDAQGKCHVVTGSTPGHRDGSAREAQFHSVSALALGADGYLHVADGRPDAGSWIRRVAPDGSVTTLAGSAELGFADGKGSAARFYLPSALAADSSNNLFAADPVNSSVRKISPDGVVSTVSGPQPRSSKGGFLQPSGVAVGAKDRLYVLDGGTKSARVTMIDGEGRIQTLAVVDSATRSQVRPQPERR